MVVWTTDWVLASASGAPMTAIASAVIAAPARMTPVSPRLRVLIFISPPEFIWTPARPMGTVDGSFNAPPSHPRDDWSFPLPITNRPWETGAWSVTGDHAKHP